MMIDLLPDQFRSRPFTKFRTSTLSDMMPMFRAITSSRIKERYIDAVHAGQRGAVGQEFLRDRHARDIAGESEIGRYRVRHAEAHTR